MDRKDELKKLADNGMKESVAGGAGNGEGLSSANMLVALQRLHSLAFGFGTFACYAKDPASSSHDGLLDDNPSRLPIEHFGCYTAVTQIGTGGQQE